MQRTDRFLYTREEDGDRIVITYRAFWLRRVIALACLATVLFLFADGSALPYQWWVFYLAMGGFGLLVLWSAMLFKPSRELRKAQRSGGYRVQGSQFTSLVFTIDRKQ